jgi:YHS domain-containing protein
MYNYLKWQDPVCRMNVDESTTQYTSKVNGKKVYLYREQCKREFDQNPEKYGYG